MVIPILWILLGLAGNFIRILQVFLTLNPREKEGILEYGEIEKRPDLFKEDIRIWNMFRIMINVCRK